MQKTKENTQEQQQDKPAEKHTGSKLAFALAFSTVGAKLSTIGTAIDAADLLRDKPTFKEKIKTLFSKEILHKLNERTIENIPDKFKQSAFMAPPTGETIKASLKTMKWTVITGVVGTVAGGVVGWVRGEKAGSAKNIVKHPIKAVKAVFGFGEPLTDDKPKEAPAVAKAPEAPSATDVPVEDKASTAWQARMAQNAAKQAETTRSL